MLPINCSRSSKWYLQELHLPVPYQIWIDEVPDAFIKMMYCGWLCTPPIGLGPDSTMPCIVICTRVRCCYWLSVLESVPECRLDVIKNPCPSPCLRLGICLPIIYQEILQMSSISMTAWWWVGSLKKERKGTFQLWFRIFGSQLALWQRS